MRLNDKKTEVVSYTQHKEGGKEGKAEICSNLCEFGAYRNHFV